MAAALSPWGSWNSLRQYLREWLYDGSDRARPCRTELDLSLCFAPLLKWALSWWCGNRLALAIDPTLKGDDTAAIVICVLYRGCAIPVAPYPVRGRLWRILPAKRPGRWMDPIVELLQALAPAVPEEMTLIVLCDRGLTSPKLWRRIRAQVWNPHVRYPKNIAFCAEGGQRLPAQSSVSRPDAAWVGIGTAFKSLPRTGYGGRAKRRCTLLVVWRVNQPEPWIILTSHPLEAVGVSWYALRFWIELGFKACPVLDTGAIKSLGWQWHKTRRTDPARISRHWLALPVATLLALAYGTRVEDANDRKLAPSNLRAPPKTPFPQHGCHYHRPVRTVSVIRNAEGQRGFTIRGRCCDGRARDRAGHSGRVVSPFLRDLPRHKSGRSLLKSSTKRPLSVEFTM